VLQPVRSGPTSMATIRRGFDSRHPLQQTSGRKWFSEPWVCRLAARWDRWAIRPPESAPRPTRRRRRAAASHRPRESCPSGPNFLSIALKTRSRAVRTAPMPVRRHGRVVCPSGEAGDTVARRWLQAPPVERRRTGELSGDRRAFQPGRHRFRRGDRWPMRPGAG
jgi:hypothetical protein